MDPETDHYRVLGLPSGEEGAKLSDREISKAYKLKALELHPDKRPDDPNAHANFHKLKSSYEILKDATARKLFDDLLRVRREKTLHRDKQKQFEGKRRKMVSDLEERERASSSATPDPEKKARAEEERIMRELQEEIARIRAMNSKSKSMAEGKKGRASENVSGAGLDTTKMVKITWDKCVGDYSESRLRGLFEELGQVEEVVIRKKGSGSALVVMATKEAAVAVIGAVSGDLSNPLHILPLQPANPNPNPNPNPFGRAQAESVKPDGPSLSNLVGAGYEAFESSVLDKLRKAAGKNKIK